MASKSTVDPEISSDLDSFEILNEEQTPSEKRNTTVEEKLSHVALSEDTTLLSNFKITKPILFPGESHESIHVAWSEPTEGAEVIKYYEIAFKEQQDQNWSTANDKISKSENHFEILSLDPGIYVVKIRALLGTRWSDYSNESKPLTIKGRRLSYQPKNEGLDTPTVEEVTHNSARLRWIVDQDLLQKINHCEVLKYEGEDAEWESVTIYSGLKEENRFQISGLRPGTQCKFQVKVRTTPAGKTTATSDSIITLPSSPPGKPSYELYTDLTVALKWEEPNTESSLSNTLGISRRQYIIEGKEKDFDTNQGFHTSEWKELAKSKKPAVEFGVKHGTIMTFRVCLYCEKTKLRSKYSPESDYVYFESPTETLKANLKKKSTRLGENYPHVYQIPTEPQQCSNEFLQKFDVGKIDNPGPMKTKVLMLVGQTGAGKSTLINSLVNYIYGVDWDDTFRFKLIHEDSEENQTESQTSVITAYTLHHEKGMRFPFSVILIDTPGYGHTGGMERDKEITEQWRSFLENQGPEGIDHVDAVGFVAKATETRFTDFQRYVLRAVFSVFGKDIENNLFLLTTYSDHTKPGVLDFMQKENLSYKSHYKFNNGGWLEKIAENAQQNILNWKVSRNGNRQLLQALEETTPVSLWLSKDLLGKRKYLERIVSFVQDTIDQFMIKLESFQGEKMALEMWQQSINENRNFTITKVEERKVYEDFGSVFHFAYNCTICKTTCHFPCLCIRGLAHFCAKLNDKHKCTVCPKGCHFSYHEMSSKKISIKRIQGTTTNEDMKNKYKDAIGKREGIQEEIANMQRQITDIQNELIKSIHMIQITKKKLSEIALHKYPSTETLVTYMNELIIKKRQDKNNEETVQALEGMKKLAEQNCDNVEDASLIEIEIDRECEEMKSREEGLTPS